MARVKKVVHVSMVDLSNVKNGESVLNKHHRKPKSRGGRSHKRNLSRVNIPEHIAYHYFFADTKGKTLEGEKVIWRFAQLYPRLEALFMHQDGTRRLKTQEEFLAELNFVWNDPDVFGVVDGPAESGLTLHSG